VTPSGTGALGWLRRRVAYQHDAWFGAADARHLAICRLLLFGYAWPGMAVPGYAEYAAYRDSAWYPVSFFRAWSVPLLGASGLEALSWVLSMASLLALVGLCYPIAAPVAALSCLYLRGVPQNFGKINHSENLLVIALLVLALSHAADAWSLDALWRRLRGHGQRLRAGGHYRWPIRFIGLLVITMYGAAGLSKLAASGWDWALGDSFRRLLLRHHFTHRPPTEWGVWVAGFPTLCRALALGALLTELLSPLALLGKWPYRVVLVALGCMQLGIYLLLGVAFRPMLPVFFCLLPWAQLLGGLDWLRAQLESRQRA
jgi:hypothetical protein